MTDSVRSWSALLVWIAAAFFIATGVGLWTMRTARLYRRGQLLHVQARYLNMGSVWEQDAFPWTFVIENNGDKDIAISRFVTACNCVSINPKFVHLPPKGSAKVTLTMNLLHSDGPDSMHEVRQYLTDVRPVIADPQQLLVPIVWRFTASVRRPFDVSPATISLGGADTLVEGTCFAPTHVHVKALHSFREVVAECDCGDVVVQVNPVPDAGSAYDLTVACSRPLHRGPFPGS